MLPVCWALKWAAGFGSAPCGGFTPSAPCSAASGTLLVGLAPAWGGLFGMMLVQGTLEVYLLHESQKLNDAIPSDQRATLISVDSMAYSLLMIPASPLVGALGDAFGQAGAGLAALGAAILASGLAAGLFASNKP